MLKKQWVLNATPSTFQNSSFSPFNYCLTQSQAIKTSENKYQVSFTELWQWGTAKKDSRYNITVLIYNIQYWFCAKSAKVCLRFLLDIVHSNHIIKTKSDHNASQEMFKDNVLISNQVRIFTLNQCSCWLKVRIVSFRPIEWQRGNTMGKKHIHV